MTNTQDPLCYLIIYSVQCSAPGIHSIVCGVCRRAVCVWCVWCVGVLCVCGVCRCAVCVWCV